MRRSTYILWAAAGYYLLARDDVRTGLDVTTLVWPVVVLGDDDTPLMARGGSAITNEYAPPRHMGVDIAVPGKLKDARALIRAVAAGRVVRAARGDRGLAVLIDHGDWASGYLHLATLDVKAGDAVKAGAQLGQMGADPLDPEGIVHLHLQLAPGGHTVNPEPYLRKAV